MVIMAWHILVYNVTGQSLPGQEPTASDGTVVWKGLRKWKVAILPWYFDYQGWAVRPPHA
jgi:hypothetical protein